MPEPLKLSVGYQLPDRYSLVDVVATYRDAVAEVYFPWYGVPDGRGVSVRFEADQKQMEYELDQLAAMGVRLHLLLNANCYGARALSRSFRDVLESMLQHLVERWDLAGVTTTSLFVARLCKQKFPQLEVRASINMEIGSPEAMRYVSDYFDAFYVARALNRDPEAIRALRVPGKKLYLLANSGCLRNCSAHIFHDNLVAHEAETSQLENCWHFRGICWEYYAKPENRDRILADSTWVRPEEIDNYTDLVDGIKLASRTNPFFGTIIKAYAERSFDGNPLNLCEPDLSAFITLENRRFPQGWHAIARDPGSPAYRDLLAAVRLPKPDQPSPRPFF
ncbi:MAG: hypothetical protein IJC73_00075 [Lentisphaeria bacterium]|nr:hypothetical protein [Lentisphaeria bacterium]